MRMTQLEYEAHEARVAAGRQRLRDPLNPSHDVGREIKRGIASERDLHSQILAECKRRGWIALHGSMAHVTHRLSGEPDFLILADNSTVLFVEVKSQSGKLTTEQLGFNQWAAKLGHAVYVVRSFEEFMKLVHGVTHA